MPLSYILTHPEETCVNPNSFGKWPSALSENQWDHLILQTHTGASFQEELSGFLNMIDAAVVLPAPKVYLYVTWPNIGSGQTFKGLWESKITTSDRVVLQCRGYFIWLIKKIMENKNAEIEIDYIPIGEVLYQLDRDFRKESRFGFTKAEDLYRDYLHLSNVGRYVASLTVLSVVGNLDVRDSAKNKSTNDSERLSFLHEAQHHSGNSKNLGTDTSSTQRSAAAPVHGLGGRRSGAGRPIVG